MSDQSRRSWGVGLAVLTVIGLGLRLINFDSGLWYDEIYTLGEYVRHSALNIVTEFRSTNNHLLYSLAAHFSVSVFGEHPWSMRLPALVFGVASIPMIYVLGQALSNRREAFLTACLLAVSYHHIWFSQNARGYTLLLFCTLLGTWLFLRLMQDRRKGLVAAYAVTAVLGAYTHLTMVLVVISHTLIWAGWLWSKRDGNEWRPYAVTAFSAVGLAAIGTILLYLPLVPQVIAVMQTPPQSAVAVATPTWAILETIKSLIIGMGGVGLIAGGILGAAGLLSFWRETPLSAAVLVVPGVVSVVGVLASGAAIRPRFFFAIMGFVLIAVVRGAMVVGEYLMALLKRERGETAGIALVSLLIVLSLASLPYGYRYPKQDFDGAVEYIANNRLIDEPIGTGGLAAYPLKEYYGLPSTQLANMDVFNDLRGQDGSIWIVYSFAEYMDAEVVEAMELCPLIEEFPGTLGGGEIVIRKCDE